MEPHTAIRLLAKAVNADALAPVVEPRPAPPPAAGEALVRVSSAGINPSDVKAALGLMPQAVFPRTPGRDYAGTVVAGPAEWIGRPVWGSAGDLGITRDGTHAGWLTLPMAALREKPEQLSMDEAGSVGVPFVTAVEGFMRSGWPQAGQVVAVMGANGKVGQAAVQLAAQAGATVVAVHRLEGPHIGHACTQVVTVNGRGQSADEIAAQVRAVGHGRGADIVFNTVGSPYFEAANKALAKRGTQILIATVERPVPFDIFTFYRGMHSFVGVDTLALDAVASATRFDRLAAGMADGSLQPFAVGPGGVYALADALAAYRRVLGGADERCVFRP